MSWVDGIEKPESIKIVVLYEKKTGDIRQIYQEIFFPGTKELDEDSIKERAFETAKKSGIESAGLEYLHISSSGFEPGIHYRVDLQKKILVEVSDKNHD